MSRILVIAPHPDDEVLGCGGTIKSHTNAGDSVTLCVVTQAYTPEWTQAFINRREEEVRRSSKVLGIKKVYTLGFPTVKLDTVGQKKLNDALSEVVQVVKPSTVYVPCGSDLNLDHRLVFQSALVAVRPFSAPSVERVLAYETLSETEWGLGGFQPTVYRDISATLRSKLSAMRQYASEMRRYPHPRSSAVITALAKKRGSESNFSAAEAFMAVRIIER